MAPKQNKKAQASEVHEIERLAHWAFMDHIRQGLLASGHIKQGDRLVIRDAVDGFFGEGEPTGHLLATDGGCFGNNFGLYRIIAYSPWFDYKEGFVAKIFADTDYWQDVIGQVPAAIDLITNLYGIKFDYHCPKNLFEARLVENPAMEDILSRDNEKSDFWGGVANSLWSRPEELYVGIRFAIVFTQGFRMRHKDKADEELGVVKDECRTLLKQLAGWKGMKYMIEEQGVRLLGEIEAELMDNLKKNVRAASKVDELEQRASKLVNERLEIYKAAYNRSTAIKDARKTHHATLTEPDDKELYDFTSSDIIRIKEIDEKMARIRSEIIPYVHEKGRTDGKVSDLSCKSAITRYAIDFFIDA